LGFTDLDPEEARSGVNGHKEEAGRQLGSNEHDSQLQYPVDHRSRRCGPRSVGDATSCRDGSRHHGCCFTSIGQGSGKRSDARRRTYARVCVCIAWANPGCAVLWDTNHMLWRTHSICGDEECRPRRGEKLTRRRDTKTTTRRQRCQAPALRACHPEGVRGY